MKRKKNYNELMKRICKKEPSWMHDPSDPAYSKYYFGFLSPKNRESGADQKMIRQAYNDRKTKGFDRSEVWNLGYVSCRLILPRLKALKETHKTVPGWIFEKYKVTDINEADNIYCDILDKLIWALEQYILLQTGELDDAMAEEMGYKDSYKLMSSSNKNDIQEHRNKMIDIQEQISTILKQYAYLVFDLCD